MRTMGLNIDDMVEALDAVELPTGTLIAPFQRTVEQMELVRAFLIQAKEAGEKVSLVADK